MVLPEPQPPVQPGSRPGSASLRHEGSSDEAQFDAADDRRLAGASPVGGDQLDGVDSLASRSGRDEPNRMIETELGPAGRQRDRIRSCDVDAALEGGVVTSSGSVTSVGGAPLPSSW
jgi:hypothetical protein